MSGQNLAVDAGRAESLAADICELGVPVPTPEAVEGYL